MGYPETIGVSAIVLFFPDSTITGNYLECQRETCQLLRGDRQQIANVQMSSLTRSLCPHLEIIPLTAEIAADAARLRARYGIRTPDAIHAATALAGGAESFITNDQGLVRLEPELKVRLLE